MALNSINGMHSLTDAAYRHSRSRHLLPIPVQNDLFMGETEGKYFWLSPAQVPARHLDGSKMGLAGGSSELAGVRVYQNLEARLSRVEHSRPCTVYQALLNFYF